MWQKIGLCLSVVCAIALAEPPTNNGYLPPPPSPPGQNGYNYPKPSNPLPQPPPQRPIYKPPPPPQRPPPFNPPPPPQKPPTYNPPPYNPPVQPTPTIQRPTYGVPPAPPTPTYGVPPQPPRQTPRPPQTPDHDHHHDHHEPGMPFDFNYAVKDDYYGTDYSHNAVSDGDVVKGQYRVQLPDGRLQIVTYTADWKNGFNADVKYEGEPRYPDQPNNAGQQQSYGPPKQGY